MAEIIRISLRETSRCWSPRADFGRGLKMMTWPVTWAHAISERGGRERESWVPIRDRGVGPWPVSGSGWNGFPVALSIFFLLFFFFCFLILS
jgi:predicted oxidoreductase